MAGKTASVTARIQPELKVQAETILDHLGIPVSVLIDTLYRQIVMTNGIPYSLTIPTPATLDTMSAAQFNSMMEKGLEQAKAGQGVDLDDAFARINSVI